MLGEETPFMIVHHIPTGHNVTIREQDGNYFAYIAPSFTPIGGETWQGVLELAIDAIQTKPTSRRQSVQS